MLKVRMVGSKSKMRQVITELYNLQLFHIADQEHKESLEIGKPFQDAETHSTHLVKLRSMTSFLKVSGKCKRISIDENQKKVNKIEKEFELLSKDLEQLTNQKNNLLQIVSNPLSRLPISGKIIQLKSIKTFTGIVNKNFLKNISHAKFNYDLIKEIVGDKIAIIFTVPSNNESEARGFLDKNGFEEKQLPDSNYDSAAKELSTIEKSIKELESRFQSFKAENSKFILNAEYSLTELLEKSEAPLRFSVSKRAFFVEGWVPKSRMDLFRNTVSDAAEGKLHIEALETEEAPPVKTDNPKLAKPFEMFLEMYSYPKKFEFEPTMILLFTFSLFFGFMLGDVGYGITLLLIAVFGYKKFSGAMKSLFYVIGVSSLFTIAFGIVFGEVFGFEFIHPVISRFHEVNKMIAISAVLGFIHIGTGLILGFVTKYKEHGLSHAIFEKGSWLALETAIIIFVLGAVTHIKTFNFIGGGLAGLGVLMLLKGEGVKGIIELPGLLSNILSYLRLFAVGLASVSLALVVNDMATGMFKGGPVWFIPGIIILLLGHTINLLLGMIGPFLHSLRLHYFEFFTKFFEGGGKPYYPFGMINKWR